MKMLTYTTYVVGIRWNLTFHEMPRHSVACRQCLKYSQKYASYSKCLKILGISWNARQRPGKYCNLAKIVRIQPLPRHYMECRPSRSSVGRASDSQPAPGSSPGSRRFGARYIEPPDGYGLRSGQRPQPVEVSERGGPCPAMWAR